MTEEVNQNASTLDEFDPFDSSNNEEFQEPEMTVEFLMNMLKILYFENADKDCDISEVEADIHANISRLTGKPFPEV